MDLEFIKEFILLANAKKFSAAAQCLHISQSTLSRHLQSLENELGHTLFIRTTREMELSPYGTAFLPYAEAICREYQNAQTELKQIESKQLDKIQIGIVHNPDRYHIIDCILSYQRTHPEVPICITEGSLNDLNEDFHNGHLHMITMIYANWETIPKHFIPAGKSRLVAVLPKTHPLASCEQISLHALEQMKLMVPEKQNFIYRFLNHMLTREMITPNIFYQGNTSGISALLKEDMGILIQDYELARSQLMDDLVLRELSPEISYTYGLRYSEHLSKKEQDYVNHVKIVFSSMEH